MFLFSFCVITFHALTKHTTLQSTAEDYGLVPSDNIRSMLYLYVHVQNFNLGPHNVCLQPKYIYIENYLLVIKQNIQLYDEWYIMISFLKTQEGSVLDLPCSKNSET